MVSKKFSLLLINLIIYPFVFSLVLLLSCCFFFAGRISFLDFVSKCGYVPLRNIEKREYLWLHVSSAGEWNTGKIFAKYLREKSGLPLLITYFNRDIFPVLEEEKVFLSSECRTIFLPIENIFSFWFIHRHYRVRALIILETEIWPSLILMAHWLGKPIFLVNAVLFFQETRNLLWFKFIFSRILRCFTHIFCVSVKTRNNFLKLGTSKENISVWPNFKYDVFNRSTNLARKRRKDKITKNMFTNKEEDQKWRELEKFFNLQKKKNHKIIVFASFHRGEFIKIIPKVKKFFEIYDYSVVIAPREIRVKSIKFLEALLKKQGLSYVKRSELGNLELNDTQSNLILDSFGELSSVYSLADLVIMGGTFIPVGGHNLLEAVYYNKKIFLGKFIYHFEDFVDLFKKYIHFTDYARLSQDIDDFFIKKNVKLKDGIKLINKFSGSSLKVANIINRKINL